MNNKTRVAKELASSRVGLQRAELIVRLQMPEGSIDSSIQQLIAAGHVERTRSGTFYRYCMTTLGRAAYSVINDEPEQSAAEAPEPAEQTDTSPETPTPPLPHEALPPRDPQSLLKILQSFDNLTVTAENLWSWSDTDYEAVEHWAISHAMRGEGANSQSLPAVLLPYCKPYPLEDWPAIGETNVYTIDRQETVTFNLSDPFDKALSDHVRTMRRFCDRRIYINQRREKLHLLEIAKNLPLLMAKDRALFAAIYCDIANLEEC